MDIRPYHPGLTAPGRRLSDSGRPSRRPTTALIAAATSGLGLAVAEELSARGANVVLPGAARCPGPRDGLLDNAFGLACDIAYTAHNFCICLLGSNAGALAPTPAGGRPGSTNGVDRRL